MTFTWRMRRRAWERFTKEINETKPRAVRRLTRKHAELMPEREHLRLEVEARADGGPGGGQQGNERGDHAGGEPYQQEPATSTNGRRSGCR